MDPEKLYNFISWYAPKLVKVTSVISRFGKYGNYFNWVFMPVFDYTRLVKYKGRPKDFILEYSVHDTFDALSPRYDKPIKLEVMRSIAKEFLKQPFEIFEGKGITLLRTVVK
jgi:hypothetical protein